ncbi:MAG: EamA family transporter, partial [Methylobacteriaceae bacterium]|nr:EamA family transporter [Methylobacteriaceae bacterium]
MTHLLAFAAMCLIWGLTWLPTKMAAAAMSPISVAACRFVLAGLLFFAYARLTGASLRTRQPARLVAASLLITTGCYAAVFWGVAHAPSGLSAIINFSSMPILIALIGAAYGEERITPPRIAAVGLGIVGLAVLFLPQMSGLEDASAVPGLVSVAIGTASHAWGAVISRPLVRELPPASIAFWETFLGGLALIPLAIGIEGWHPERYANFVHDP